MSMRLFGKADIWGGCDLVFTNITIKTNFSVGRYQALSNLPEMYAISKYSLSRQCHPLFYKFLTEHQMCTGGCSKHFECISGQEGHSLLLWGLCYG